MTKKKSEAALAAENEQQPELMDEAYGAMQLEIAKEDSELVNRYVRAFMFNLRVCLKGQNFRYFEGGSEIAREFVELVSTVTIEDLDQYREEVSWRGAIAHRADKNLHHAAWLVSAPLLQKAWYRDMVASVVPVKEKKRKPPDPNVRRKAKSAEPIYRPLNPTEWEWFIDRLFATVKEKAGELLK